MFCDKKTTIAAIATPPGEGGVAIIRVSGDSAVEIVDTIFSGPITTYKTHTAHLGKILDKTGCPIDEVLVLVMHAPKSYTGENTVEIHCHGGILITQKVLERTLQAGAKAASPGEFTFRAFINGKLDLAQAEAVQTVIGARNERALASAKEHLQGSLSKKITSWQKTLIDITATLEACLDFPEEGLDFETETELLSALQSVHQEIEKLLSTFDEGKKIQDGLSLCLLGAPNVGKSSLMNALLGIERAIVTNIAGTTRDVLEAPLMLSGLHCQLLDTAGIHTTEDLIEEEGIKRAKVAMEKADLILYVLDSSRHLNHEEYNLLETLPKTHTILVWNKQDLPQIHASHPLFPYQVHLSATTLQGIDSLKKTIAHVIKTGMLPSKEEVIISSLRHKEALHNASFSIRDVTTGIKNNASPEILCADMRHTLKSLGDIIGMDISEEILTAIFSKFCLGK